MWSTSFYRSSRTLGSLTTQRILRPQFSQLTSQRLSYPRVPVALDSKPSSRPSYHTTPILFSKYERFQDHPNINKTLSSATTEFIEQEEARGNLSQLSGADDLMVGNEGLETIDPKDFPELYPGHDDIEGLNQEWHPDDDRDFEQLKEHHLESSIQVESVLLSDKERSEAEFSWFVDEAYPEKSLEDRLMDSPDDFASDFIPLWQMHAQRDPAVAHKEEDIIEYSADSIAGLVKMIESERAKNVKIIDMRDKCDWTNWMVIAEGLSERHLGNLADQIYSSLKKSSPKTSPPIMEGRDASDWIVIDAGTVVIHFMTPEARKERDLEGLWASVKNPLKLKDTEQISWEDVKGQMTKSWKESP
ncbi:hypothetical protein BGX34_003641, partial [Mortierella sp. NVP85]